MPIVQDPDKSLPLASKIWPENVQSRIQKLPDEINRTIPFLDGPVGVPSWIPSLEAKAEVMVQTGGEARTSDRQELMERIKRGESPTWVPSHAVRIRTRGQPSRSSRLPWSYSLDCWTSFRLFTL